MSKDLCRTTVTCRTTVRVALQSRVALKYVMLSWVHYDYVSCEGGKQLSVVIKLELVYFR